MKKKLTISVVVILIILIGVIMNNRGKKVIKEEKTDVGIPVKVAPVETADIKEVVSVSGDVKPWAEVTIYPEVTGRVEKIPVREGQYVKKGDIIAEIDYEKNALTVQQIENQLKSAEINLEGVKRDYERMKRLFEQKVVSEKTFEDTKTALDAGTYSVESLRSQLGLAKIKLKDSKITAPISGIISKKFVDEGELVTESSMSKSAPLVTIVDMQKVKVVVPVGEKDIGKVKKGQKVEIVLDAYPEKKFIGEVYNIFPVMDFQTRTAQVEILINNSTMFLKPGMFARTDIIIQSRKNAIVIPFDTIVGEDDEKHIFVAVGDRAVLRKVITGLQEREIVEIISGIEKGELLIVEGQHSVKDGDKIFIVNKEQEK